MNRTSPGSTGSPDGPTPVAWEVRAEWSGRPPSLALEEAGRALDALSRAAGEAAGNGGTSPEVPPVPEDLRARWADAYGRPEAETERPRAQRPSAGERREPRVFGWLRLVRSPRGMAWLGGAGVAAAVLTLMLNLPGEGPGRLGAGSPDVTIRGGPGPLSNAEPAPIVVVAAAAVDTERVLAVVKQAFPVRAVRVVATADAAAALAQSESRLVVVNLGSGLVTAWRDGQLDEEFPAGSASGPGAVVSQIESADESLEKAVASP